MKDNFKDSLLKDEKILFEGETVPINVKGSIGKILFALFYLLAFFCIIFYSCKTYGVSSDDIFGFIIVSLAIAAVIYTLIYNLFIIKKNKPEHYYVTNKRVAVYNLKKGVREVYLSTIDRVGISMGKNNYGILSIFCDFVTMEEGDIVGLIESMKKSIGIEGIEDPYKIAYALKNINNELVIYEEKSSSIFDKKNKKNGSI